MAELTILHTNDLHGSLTDALADRLRAIPRDLFFDTGDCIKPGNLAIPAKPDPAWERLARAGCDAGVPGNRESHPLEAGFRAKVAGAEHPLLCANLRAKDGTRPLPATLVVEKAGLRVGLVGVMVPIVTDRMATRGLSAYLWDPPIPAAADAGLEVRGDVDLLIALTHIGFAQDRKLAEAAPHFDLILGGHSHTVLEQPAMVNGVAIAQGGSHARFVGRYVWRQGYGLVEAMLEPLKDGAATSSK